LLPVEPNAGWELVALDAELGSVLMAGVSVFLPEKRSENGEAP
jgi:hypothetical protein